MSSMNTDSSALERRDFRASRKISAEGLLEPTAQESACGPWEKTEKIVRGFKMRDVNRICVGKKAETKVLAKRFEQRIVLHRLRIERAIPGFRELVEAERTP
jgi:hypothetical protein